MKVKTSHRIISLFLSIVMILLILPVGSISVFASNDGEGLEYTLNDDGQSYTVTGIGAFNGTELIIPSTYNNFPVTQVGEQAFYACDKISSVVISNGIKSIGRCAFGYCPNLETVILPDSVTSIENGAFMICGKLKSVTMPKVMTNLGASVFHVCYSLESIVIPDGISSIPDYAFYSCGLTSINIPESVINIGSNAFGYCTALKTASYAGSETQWNNNIIYSSGNEALIKSLVFSNNIDIDDSSNDNKENESIGNDDFEQETENFELEFTLSYDSESYIVSGVGSFEGNSLIIPSEYNGLPVTKIGQYAFAEQSCIESVTLPDSIITIDYGAFFLCSNLKTIKLGSSIEMINQGAFYLCDKIIAAYYNGRSYDWLSVMVSLDNESLINALVFEGLGDNNDDLGLEYALTDDGKSYSVIGVGSFNGEQLDIPDTYNGKPVVKIAEGAFMWFSVYGFRVILPDTITEIDDNAFRDNGISYIYIPNGVERIGEGAFAQNELLKHIKFPKSVTNIGWGAFSGTTLTNAIYAGTEAEWISNVECGDYNETLINVLSFSDNQESNDNENEDNQENEDNDNQGGPENNDSSTEKNGFSVFSDISSLSVKKGGKITIGVSAYTDGEIVENISGITFSIDNSNIAKRSKVSSLNNQLFYVTLEGNDIGTTYITFSDSNTGFVVRVPITVFQDHLHSYTLGAVPTQNIDKYESNFYNVNGLFVDNYTYTIQADGRANVSFDVYNTNYIYGMVEIYDSNGLLKDAVMIDKVKNNATSIKGAVWDNFWCLARDIVDGDLLTYRQESGYSKKTSISVTIPKDGYIKITNDPQTSWLVSLINGVDLTMQISSLNKKVSNYDPNDSGFVSELTKKIVNEKIKAEAINKSQDLVKELNKNIATNMSKSSDALGNFINTFTKNLNALNFDEIVIETCSDMGIGMAENVFTYFAGPIGKILEASFTGIEFGNMTLQFCHFMQYSNAGAIVIQNQGGGVRSAEQIRVESQVDFDDDVALDVYKVEPSLDFLKKLKHNYPDLYNEHRQGLTYTYNITLVKNGTETQPDGEVDVYITIPQNLRNISYSGNVKVYRIEEDNTLTEMDAKISGDCLVFKTTHFSLYTIVAETVTDEPISDVLDYSYTMLDDNFIAITKYNGTDSKIAIPSVIDGYVVTQISSYCFANNSNIQYVELPNGMMALGDKAFSSCTNLNSIFIYNNIEGIGNSALENCPSLKTIYYSGTETEWNNIKVYPNNDCLSDINVVFESLSSNIDLQSPPDNSDNSHKVHTGGDANCKNKAICEVCGEEYGGLAPHKDEDSNGVCDDCSEVISGSSDKTNDNSVNDDNDINNVITIVVICICLIVLFAGGGLACFCVMKKKK